MKHKKVVMIIEEPACEAIVNAIRLCPQVIKISVDNVDEIYDATDVCMRNAIAQMRDNGAFRKPSDYAYIMMASNEGIVKGVPFFYSPKDFLEYLSALGLERLPGRSTLYDTLAKVNGHYPDWKFSDAPRPAEKIRRNNVVRLFMSAFYRAKRGLSDGSPE